MNLRYAFARFALLRYFIYWLLTTSLRFTVPVVKILAVFIQPTLLFYHKQKTGTIENVIKLLLKSCGVMDNSVDNVLDNVDNSVQNVDKMHLLSTKLYI